MWYAFRCWIGRPATYQSPRNGGDWWYAMCKHCHRQAEVHEGIGGPSSLQ